MAGDDSKPQELATAWSTSCGSQVLSLLVSCKGHVAAVTSRKVTILDAADPYKIRNELQGNVSGITYAVFSADGANLIVGHNDGFLTWWEVDTGEASCNMQFPFMEAENAQSSDSSVTGPPPIAWIACSQPALPREGSKELAGKAADSLVAVAGGRSICVFRQGGELLQFRQGREHVQTIGNQKAAVSSLLLLGSSELLAAVGNQIQSWALSGDGYKVLKEGPTYVTEPAARIISLAVSPNGQYLAAACVTGAVQVWNVAREGKAEPVKPVHKFPTAMEPQANPAMRLGCMVVWDPSSQFLVTAKENDALVWEVTGVNSRNTKEKTVCMTPDSSTLTCLAFQPDGHLLGAATNEGHVYMFDCFSLGGKGSTFGSSQLTNHVARARVGGTAAAAAKAITAVCWRPGQGNGSPGLLLVGDEEGEVTALKQAQLPSTEAAPEGHTSLKDILSVNPKLLDVNTSRTRNSMQPAGWGGQPLLTNGMDPAGQPAMGFMRQPPPAKRGHPMPLPNANGMHPPSPQSSGPAPPAAPPPQPSSTAPATGPSQQRARTSAGAGAGNPAGPGPNPRGSQRPRQGGPPLASPPQMAPAFRPDMQPGGMMPHADAQQIIPGWGMMPLQGYRWPMQHIGAMPYTQIMPAAHAMPHMAGGMMPFMSPMQHPYAAMPPSPGGAPPHPAHAHPMHGMPPPAAPMPAAPTQNTNHEPRERERDPRESREAREPREREPPSARKSGGGAAAAAAAAAAAPNSNNASSSASHSEGGSSSSHVKPTLPHPMAQPPKGPPPRPAMPGMHMGAAPMYMYPQPHPHWGMGTMGAMAYPQQWPSYGYFYHPFQQQVSPVSMVPHGQGPASRSGATTPFSQQGSDDSAPPPQVRLNHGHLRGGHGVGAPDDRASSYSKAGSMSEAGSVVDSDDKVVLTLYVGNLAPAVDEAALEGQFAQFGQIQHCQVIRDKTSGQSRGFGFVTYQHPSCAQNAMQHMNAQVVTGPFDGRQLRVKPSNKR